VNALAARFGVAMPDGPQLASAAAALIVILLAWLVAGFAGRRAGPALARFWARHAGVRQEGLADRMCAMVRYLVASLVLAVAIVLEPWMDLAEFLLGIGLGSAAGLLIYQLIRGLHLPRWAAALLGAVAFVGIVADVMDGLDPVTGALNKVGFNAGETRISLLTVLQIAVTLLILFAVVRLASRVINQQIRRTRGLDATQQLLAQKLAGVALLIAAFFIGIDIVGIDLTALAVFSGAVGLAIGFGLQKTFGNLIAGIILLMDRSIKPGDVIAVGDSFGTVNKIGVRAVSIITREAKEHLIPNELLMTEEVVNWSYSSRNVRISIPVGVAYDCDLPLAQRLMLEAAVATDRVLENPPPKVWLRAFGESSVDHEIRIWIQDPEDGLGSVRSEILNRLWILFRENGIDVPYPQRDIRVKEWPTSQALPPEA